jgi:aminoglycoside/choline kinase family phosphotransferase
MQNRETLLSAFLSTTRWEKAIRTPMAADASGRSYERLKINGFSAILMNAPYERGEDVRPFIEVTNMLIASGLAPPQIFAQDTQHGFLILEDLGDDLLARVCERSPDLELSMYEAAIDVLCELHTKPAPKKLQHYDQSIYLREARLLTEWYIPAVSSKINAEKINTGFDSIAGQTFAKIPSNNPVLTMRDYHAENLIWLPHRTGVKRVGLLDYQDALAGHPAYDLVSLLEDARRDTSRELQEKMIVRYLDLTKTDSETFRTVYALLGAQRNLKIIGIFSRLSIRDGKAHYVELIPRVWDHLMRDLQHPACAQLLEWTKKNLPSPTIEARKKLVRSQ